MRSRAGALPLLLVVRVLRAIPPSLILFYYLLIISQQLMDSDAFHTDFCPACGGLIEL